MNAVIGKYQVHYACSLKAHTSLHKVYFQNIDGCTIKTII